MNNNYTLRKDHIIVNDSYGNERKVDYHPQIENILKKENEIELLEENLQDCKEFFHSYLQENQRIKKCVKKTKRNSIIACTLTFALTLFLPKELLLFSSILGGGATILSISTYTTYKMLKKDLEKTYQGAIFLRNNCQEKIKKAKNELINLKKKKEEKQEKIIGKNYLIKDKKELLSLKNELISSIILGENIEKIYDCYQKGNLQKFIYKIINQRYDISPEHYPEIYQYIDCYMKENYNAKTLQILK